MKKLLIVSLGVCMLGTACSRDTNRIEENTLQQSQEQSVILQTETEEFDIPATKESSLEQEVLLALEEPSETAGLSEAEYMEEPTEASEERIEQLLKQAETDADQDRYYIVEAIDNEEANKRDTDAKLFIKEQYPDYFSSTELLERGIKYGHYEETIYSEFADKNNGYGKYYQMGKILSDTTQRIYMGTSSLDDDDVMEQLTQLEELLRNNIDEVANHVAALVPEANVVFAHGQMHEHELEKIMLDFVEGNIDVLVSTTIIETGLDIPNANTIIIHDADRLGLSQLYQIRGRVGRSGRTSYAFLMYRRDKLLREEAEKRLQAIREFTELGSGIKIAMRDLELRGAGNLLGAEQHGHMQAVGYDLYCKLLNEAVLALRGENEAEDFETVVDCDIDAYIPPSYIRNEYQKLDVYKRISGIENQEEYMDMQDELIDRFGEIPRSVENLLKIADLKALAHQAGVVEVDVKKQDITIQMYQKADLDVSGIPALMEKYKGTLTFRTGDVPSFYYRDVRQKHTDCETMLVKAREILSGLAALAKK